MRRNYEDDRPNRFRTGAEVRESRKERNQIAKAAPYMLEALREIELACNCGMGEWSSVLPPYLPANIETLYDIRETARAAIAGAEVQETA